MVIVSGVGVVIVGGVVLPTDYFYVKHFFGTVLSGCYDNTLYDILYIHVYKYIHIRMHTHLSPVASHKRTRVPGGHGQVSAQEDHSARQRRPDVQGHEEAHVPASWLAGRLRVCGGLHRRTAGPGTETGHCASFLVRQTNRWLIENQHCPRFVDFKKVLTILVAF